MLLTGLDTETTSTYFKHGARPFFISMSDESGLNPWYWEFKVNPLNRKPILIKSEIAELRGYLRRKDLKYCLHNAKFDARALATIIPDFDPIEFLSRCHDTSLMSHVVDSNGSHKLKDLAVLHLGISDGDQKALQDVVNICRKFGTKMGWAIASKVTIPQMSRAPKTGGWGVMDMWLPRAVVTFAHSSPENQKLVDRFLERHGLTEEILLKVCSEYACQDAVRTVGLAQLYLPYLEEHGLMEQYENQLKQLVVTYEMEEDGVSIHEDELYAEIDRLEAKCQEYTSVAAGIIGNPDINLRSTDQMREAMYTQLEMPVTETTKTEMPACNKNVIEKYLKSYAEEYLKPLEPPEPPELEFTRYEFLRNVTLAKRCRKCITDLKGYSRVAKLGRLYPNFNIIGTHTTRFSSSDPNGQNIGKGKDAFLEEINELKLSIRKIFGPAVGREWWTVDYVQLQLVIFAYVSQDKEMIKAAEAGFDFHDFMARMIFKIKPHEKITEAQRRIGKNVNFGFIFGAGPAKIEQTARMPGLYATVAKLFPNATRYIEKNIKQVERTGVVFAAGYPLVVPSDKPYAATNYIVQGWEGMIVKQAMSYCYDYLKAYCPEGFITLNVHDELIFDFPVGVGEHHIPHLCYYMEEAGRKYDVPCKVDAKYIERYWNQGIEVSFATST